MSRMQLEQLNIELRELPRQVNVDTKGTRATLFDRLTDHFERNGWPERIAIAAPGNVELVAMEEGDPPRVSQGENVPSDNRADETVSVRGNSQIQEIVQAVLQALSANRMRQPDGDALVRGPASPSTSSGAHSAFPNWHQIYVEVNSVLRWKGRRERGVMA